MKLTTEQLVDSSFAIFLSQLRNVVKKFESDSITEFNSSVDKLFSLLSVISRYEKELEYISDECSFQPKRYSFFDFDIPNIKVHKELFFEA